MEVYEQKWKRLEVLGRMWKEKRFCFKNKILYVVSKQ